MSPPDGLLTPNDDKHDVDLDPDPFLSDKCFDDSPPASLYQLTTIVELNMNTSEDEPSTGLNGRLRPRKASYVSSPQNKANIKTDGKLSQERPKRTSTPSKPSPNKQDDLPTKSDFSPTPQFLCPYCDKKFASRQTMSKHVRRNHLPNAEKDISFSCLFCNHTETDTSIIRHMVDSHPNQYFACLDCHTRFSSTSELAEHKLHICDKQKLPFRTTLRQKTHVTKKPKKSLNIISKEENKEFQESHGFNGIVISCELKPPQDHDGADIEDNITTNLILPPSKNLGNNAILEKNAVIVLDDIQWNKRIPANFSFHNTDPDQILSRLGVVHRSPRTGEPTKKDWFKLMDDSTQKFERCFDTKFYSKVASNVQENLTKFLDGSFNFNPDPENTIKTRKTKNNVVINTAEGFPILLAFEQYSRSVFDSYLPRAIAPKHKWKWDNLESDKCPLNPDQIKRDSHTNNCIITLVSGLDIWTQLSMRKKYENIYNNLPVEKKTEKQNIIGKELKEILESREIPSSSQVVRYVSKPVASTSKAEFPAALGLVPATPTYDLQPAVLSGEWVRPRCYVCCACGEQTTDPKGLSTHIIARHPNAQVQHYEIVGELLLNADILKHLYVPPRTNRTRLPRGFKECTKCNKSVTLEELHQHMLDCAGDTPAVRRRQCRHRPFNVRRRRPRIPDNTIRKKMRKDMRSRKRRQKAHIRPRPRIRTEVGDAETIRKMLADLPAKRHRVLVNPVNMNQRPRRKLDMQRSLLMRSKRNSDEIKNRNRQQLTKASSSDKKTGSTKITDESNKNSSSLDDDDDKPLKPKEDSKVVKSKDGNRTMKPKLKKIINKCKHQREALNRKSVVASSKRKSIRVQKKTIESADKGQTKAVVASSSVEIQESSIDKPTERLDLRKGSYNTREHANRGASGNREGQSNHGNPDSSGTNGAENNARGAQNVPLKHSIARLTANSETHDKSVQFHHSFLVQQECNDTNQHVPTGQPTLFENEAVVTKLDKPPLNFSQKSVVDAQGFNKSKLNKPRKGLNDCIAMLKNKLVEPEPFPQPGHISVQCGSDEPIDIDPRIDMNQKMRTTSTNSECYEDISSDKSCEQLKSEDPKLLSQTLQKTEYEELTKVPANINDRKEVRMDVQSSENKTNKEMKSSTLKENTEGKSLSSSSAPITSQNVGPKRNSVKTARQQKCFNNSPNQEPNTSTPKPDLPNKHHRITRAARKQMERNLLPELTSTPKMTAKSLNKNITEKSAKNMDSLAPKILRNSPNIGSSVAHDSNWTIESSVATQPIDVVGKVASISPQLIEKGPCVNVSPRSPEMSLNASPSMSNRAASISPRAFIANKSPRPMDMNLLTKFDVPRNVEPNLNEKVSPHSRLSFERHPLSVDVSAELHNLQSMEVYKESTPIKIIQASPAIDPSLSWRNTSDLYAAQVDVRSTAALGNSAINLNKKDVRVGVDHNPDGFSENRIIDVTPNILPAHCSTIVEPLVMVGPLDLSSKVNTSKESSTCPNTSFVSNYNSYETLDLSNKSSSSRLPHSYLPDDVVVDLRVKPTEPEFTSETLDLCVKTSSTQKYIMPEGQMPLQEDSNYPTDLSLKRKETQLLGSNRVEIAQNMSSYKNVRENFPRAAEVNPVAPADLSAKIVVKQSFSEDYEHTKDNTKDLFTDQIDLTQSKKIVFVDDSIRKPSNKKSSENVKLSLPVEPPNKIEHRRGSEKNSSKINKSRFPDKYSAHIPKPVYDPTLKIPQFKLRPESGDMTEVMKSPIQLTEDLSFSHVSVGFQNTSQVFENVSRGALTGGVALQTLPNPDLTHNQMECSTPMYSVTNVVRPGSKIESSKSPVLTNALLTLPVSTIINSSTVFTQSTSIANASKFSNLNNELPIPLCPSSQNNKSSPITGAFRNETANIENNVSSDKHKRDAVDQDPDTARKIAMLPKELVEILGNMPVDHRNQLLNVLPQYVSPSVAGTTPLPSKANEVESVPKINITNMDEQKINMPASEDSSKCAPTSPTLRQNSPTDSLSQKTSSVLGKKSAPLHDLNTLDPARISGDKFPTIINKEFNATPKKLTCMDDSAEDVETEKITTDTKPLSMTDKGVAIDYAKTQERVIDLTEDELVPSVPKVLELPRSSQLIPKEPVNPVVGNVTLNKQKGNEKTASLRAVRIKAPSERQKESQMLKRASVEQVVPQIIPETDDIDICKSLELNKTLAIQQAEISSTQHNKVIKTDFSLIKELVPVDKTEVTKTKSPTISNAVVDTKTELEKLKEILSPTPIIETEKIPIPEVKSHDHETAIDEHDVNPDLSMKNECDDEKSPNNITELKPNNENKSLTCEIELSLNETSKIETEQLNQNAPILNKESNISEHDDSEDDMILAAIVKQKQADRSLQNELDVNLKKGDQIEYKKQKKIRKTKKSSKVVKSRKNENNHKEESTGNPEDQNIDTINHCKGLSKKKNKKSKECQKSTKQNKGPSIMSEDASNINIGYPSNINPTNEKIQDAKINSDKIIIPSKQDVETQNNDVLNADLALCLVPQKISDPFIRKERKSVNQTKNKSKKKKADNLKEKDHENNSTESDLTQTNKERKQPSESNLYNSSFLKGENEDAGDKTLFIEASIKYQQDANEIHSSKNSEKAVKFDDGVQDSSYLDPTSEVALSLRRSRRGKSLHLEENEIISENEINTDNTIDHKAPLTKKQLIFSKLLLDEEIQNKTVDTNDDKVTSVSCDVQKDSSNTANEKNKSVKRKQALQLKRKYKKKKSVDSLESLIDVQVSSDFSCDKTEELELEKLCKVIEMSESPAVVDDTKEDKKVSGSISQNRSDTENASTLSPVCLEKDLDDKKTSLEKRKISSTQLSSIENELSSKPKKHKFNKIKELDSTHSDDTIKENDIKTDNAEPLVSSELPPLTCYDVPLAARKTRSKSVLVKSSSTDVYDPYDIDLDEMIQKPEPIRKPTAKQMKVKGKTKTFASKQLEHIKNDDTCKDLGSNDSIKLKSKKNKPETIVKYTKHDKDLDVIQKVDTSSSKNSNEVTNKIIKDVSSDSDDSSKSINIPLKQYVESKAEKISENNDAKLEVKGNSDDEGRKKDRSLSVDCHKNDKSIESTDENEEQMRSEQFMESFGFFSERKPRKSNLLATKKISETFHIIASESDDSYIESGERNTRKNVQSDMKKTESDKKSLKKGRKKKNSVLEKVTYCEVCKKEFHRPDNYARHVTNILHVTRVALFDLGMNILPVHEAPNYYASFKLQLDHARDMREKNKHKIKKGKKVLIATMTDMLRESFRTVRAQRLLRFSRRDLSSDEALFIDCCELLKESHKPAASNVEVTEMQLQPSSSNLNTIDDSDEKNDSKDDLAAPKSILDSEEFTLEQELLNANLLKNPVCFETPCITGTAKPRVVANKIFLQPDYAQAPQEPVSQNEASDSEPGPELQKTVKVPEIKEKMYPDIEEIDMFEDKFDKIKRKCRSQAAAAKQTQPVAEPSPGYKGRKKADKKKAKKYSKKNAQNTVLTKGALKGFEGIKVSIPTTDINVPGIAPTQDVAHKKRRKISSRKKREKKDSETSKYENDLRNKDVPSSQKVDVYEFMDNEDAELFEFRPSTLMERFKSISNKETPNISKRESKVDDVENSSESGSDEDDFVYMSDDYVCSDDETENSLLSCDVGMVKTDSKKPTMLKRKDVVEKNAVMGKIFKHNAVRSEKKISKKETVKPKANLDQLFDSLLVEEQNSSSLNADSQSPTRRESADSSLSPRYEITKLCSSDPTVSKTTITSQSPERNNKLNLKSFDDERDLSPIKYETHRRHLIGPTTSASVDIYGPSTSKKFDTILTRDSSLTPIKKHNTTLRKIIDIPSPRTNVNLDLVNSAINKQHESEFSIEFDDDTGVARQRARRKCTVGKQNVLAETWSSESEPDGIPPRPNSAESVAISAGRKKKGRKKDGQHFIGRRGKMAFSKKHVVESRVNSSSRKMSSSSGGVECGGGEPAAVAPGSPVAGPSCAAPAPKVRPRPAAYYWSSEGDDEQEHQQQHGWIVGDSHKKLVTMLAHAKGRKRNNEDKRHLIE